MDHVSDNRVSAVTSSLSLARMLRLALACIAIGCLSPAAAGGHLQQALGVNEHALAGGDQLVGWQVADRWYFGRAKQSFRHFGATTEEFTQQSPEQQSSRLRTQKSLALIWQRSPTQDVTLSTRGLRISKRFR